MSRLDLSGLRTFITIAEQGSLRAAAKALGVNPPAVSLQLKAFEERLGVVLFTRSTRSVTLTDAGQRLLEDTRHLLAAVDAALESARLVGTSRAGQLRISLPYRAWQLVVAPRLSAFQGSYPEVDLDLSIEEGLTDIVANGFHAGIRLGDYLQAEMIALRLTEPLSGCYLASPGYLARFGTPTHPTHLLSHRCIGYRQVTSGRIADWQFQDGAETVSMPVPGRLVLNDLRTVIDAARHDLGIAWSLRSGVREEIERGDLIEVLSQFVVPRPAFYLYFPRSMARMGLLRLFIDHFGLRRAGAADALPGSTTATDITPASDRR